MNLQEFHSTHPSRSVRRIVYSGKDELARIDVDLSRVARLTRYDVHVGDRFLALEDLDQELVLLDRMYWIARHLRYDLSERARLVRGPWTRKKFFLELDRYGLEKQVRNADRRGLGWRSVTQAAAIELDEIEHRLALLGGAYGSP